MVSRDGPRKILHVDMDAFYASVEQRDRPELRGKPVVVGGSPRSRGVVCAASYEARAFGVHSAMPSSQASRLCPQATFLPPDFSRYTAVSKQVRGIFRRATDLVEPVSLDEAYLDVTENKLELPSATWVAQHIRRTIRDETGLTASAGVAPNKFLAKVASDVNKPDGICVIAPEQVAGFLVKLPVRRVPGVGPVTERACHERGIRTCGDFLRFSEEQLAAFFGKAGPWFARLASGSDPRPVVVHHTRKSCGIEDTFPTDITSLEEAVSILERLAEGLAGRLERAGTAGRTLTLKVKYADFRVITRSRTLETHLRNPEELHQQALELLPETQVGELPVRLLGISLSNLLGESHEEQLHLPFAD